MTVEIHPITPDRLNDMADLFTRKGPRGGTPATDWCWCMWWRARTHNRSANHKAMTSIVKEGGVPGLLAYTDGIPVGWMSIAPRETHGNLMRSPTLKPDDPDAKGVYAVTCFYVHPDSKRQGVAKALLEAAKPYVKKSGGKVIEAYPSRDDRKGPTDYMGTESLFLKAGFEPHHDLRGRTVVRFSVSTRSKKG